MAASLVQLLLLVTAGVLLSFTEAQEAYNRLPDGYRRGVDLALQQLNSHRAVQHHFLYFKTIYKSEYEVKKMLYILYWKNYIMDMNFNVHRHTLYVVLE